MNNVKNTQFDVVIIGAGIIGLTVAYTILKKAKNTKIAIFEKEVTLGVHSSGRNSGVLHSGIYYSPDSLKAKYCITGSEIMKSYLRSKKINYNQIGKIIVASSTNDEELMENLFLRAKDNNAIVERKTPTQLSQMEPLANNCLWGIFAKETSVVNPRIVLTSLKEDLEKRGVVFYFNTKLNKFNVDDGLFEIENKRYNFSHLFNCAGLNADKIAKKFGVGEEYNIIPFKGVYRTLLGDYLTKRINHLIYPLPNPKMPFLGIHTTTSVDGIVNLGPTAVPAFGRENYSWVKGIELSESFNIIFHLLKMTLSNTQNIRHLAFKEIKTLSKIGYTKEVKKIIPQFESKNLGPISKVGLRSQLLNKRTNTIEMDFVVKKEPRSTHVLNTISPGFTSSFSFAEHIVKGYL